MNRGAVRPLLAATIVAGATLVPAAGASDGDVRVTLERDGRSTPCPRLDPRGLVSGGCDVTAHNPSANFTVLSAFGAYHLAECTADLRLYVGPDGQLAVTDAIVGPAASGADNACGDILACRRNPEADENAAGGKVPWQGRLLAVGGRLARAEINVCLDTCLGRFEGPIELRLTHGADGIWRLRANRVAVGESGLELTGSWALRGTFAGAGRLELSGS